MAGPGILPLYYVKKAPCCRGAAGRRMAATTGPRHAIRTGGRTGKDKDMAVESIFMPDARDLDVLSVKPVRALESCNHLLDDHAAMMRFPDQGRINLTSDGRDPGTAGGE